jgi:dUTP pyrophosphatase
MKLSVKLLHESAVIPTYAHASDAGADLCSVENVTLTAGQRQTVATGVAVELPNGYAGFIHPRSGLAAKKGITIVNAPGTIDAGYRGEIKVTLLNTDLENTVEIKQGDRIAQLIIQKVESATFEQVNELSDSQRGLKGFGSTGQ